MTRIWKWWKINCGNRSIKLRTSSTAKVNEWVTEINKAGMRPQEGWCHIHRFGSYAPQRGLAEDGSQAQWFIDGQAAFKAIASSIENAKSEVRFFLIMWLHGRHSFHVSVCFFWLKD